MWRDTPWAKVNNVVKDTVIFCGVFHSLHYCMEGFENGELWLIKLDHVVPNHNNHYYFKNVAICTDLDKVDICWLLLSEIWCLSITPIFLLGKKKTIVNGICSVLQLSYELNVFSTTKKKIHLNPWKKKTINTRRTQDFYWHIYDYQTLWRWQSLRLSLIAQWKNISNRSDKSSVKSFLQCDGGNAVICKY